MKSAWLLLALLHPTLSFTPQPFTADSTIPATVSCGDRRRCASLRTTPHRPIHATLQTYWGDAINSGYLITCPNGDPGSVRLQRSSNIISEVGLDGMIKTMEFDTDDEDRIRGCYNSHIEVLRQAKKDFGGGGGMPNLFGDLFGQVRGCEERSDEDVELETPSIKSIQTNSSLHSSARFARRRAQQNPPTTRY